MKYFLWSFLFLFSKVYGLVFQVEADEVKYEKNKICFKNEVEVAEMGNFLKANELVLFFDQNQKNLSFSFLEAHGNVFLNLFAKGTLQADHLVADLLKRKVLASSELKKRAIFQTHLPTKEENIPLEVKAEKLEFFLSATQPMLTKWFDRAIFSNNIEVTLPFGTLKADKVETDLLEKLISCEALENKSCQILYKDNVFFTKKGIYRFEKKDLQLTDFLGKFLENDFLTNATVSCQKFTYKCEEHYACLKEKVEINSPTSGTLKTDEIHLFENDRVKGHELKRASIIGKSYFEMTQPKKLEFFVDGDLLIDNELCFVTAQSSLKSVTYPPVFLKNDQGSLSASKAKMTYSKENKKIAFKSIHFDEKVHFDIHQEPLGSSFCLASSLTYFPEEKKMILSGDEKERVLFFKEDGNLSMSASKLEIYDLMNMKKKEKIQGIGEVHFTFNVDENRVFKEVFPSIKERQKK